MHCCCAGARQLAGCTAAGGQAFRCATGGNDTGALGALPACLPARGAPAHSTLATNYLMRHVGRPGSPQWPEPCKQRGAMGSPSCPCKPVLGASPRPTPHTRALGVVPMAQDDLSLHGGCPVVKGHKWSATKWIRAERFYMEGEQMEGQVWAGRRGTAQGGGAGTLRGREKASATKWIRVYCFTKREGGCWG